MSKQSTVKLKSNGRIGFVIPSTVQQGGVQPCGNDYRRVCFPSDAPTHKRSTCKAVIQIVHHSKLEDVLES